MSLPDFLARVVAILERAHVRYMLTGSLASAYYSAPRATQDLDVFIAPDEENVDRLKEALKAVFEDPHVDEITAEDLLGDYPAVQYIPPEGSFHLDILTRLGEAYRFEDLDSERVDFDGLEVSVVTAETLYRMKRSTVRPQDWGDAERLRQRFGFEDS